MNCLLFLLLIMNIFCTHCASVFRVVLERVENVAHDETYVYLEYKTFKINRTNVALNETLIIFRPLPPNVMVHLRTYEFLNNEYKPFAIDYENYYCNYLAKEYKMIFYREFNKPPSQPLPPKCPVLPGTYSIINHVFQSHFFPMELPFKRGMLEFHVYLQKNSIIHTKSYFSLDRDAIYREVYG